MRCSVPGKWLVLVVAIAFLCPYSLKEAIASPTSNDGQAEVDPYLLLVGASDAARLTPERVQVFSKSPYDGVATFFLGAYAVDPVPSPSQMESTIAGWKKIANKDFWPWVNINRMVGRDPTRDNPRSDNSYFKKIRGMDLGDETGARKDFLQNWQNSLRVAKDTHAPGVVLDLEFYNNYVAYDPVELARQLRKKPEDTVELLHRLGEKMADIANSEYADAKLWSLFTYLEHPQKYTAGGKSFYPAPAYIVMGLLDRLKESHSHAKFIDGGEINLGYCHTSIDQLKMKIRNRDKDMGSALQKYAGILQVGAPLTLWSDASLKTDWMAQGFCGESPARNVEELEPYLELLLKTHEYVWVYASDKGRYDPFNPKIAPRFDAVVRQARERGH